MPLGAPERSPFISISRVQICRDLLNVQCGYLISAIDHLIGNYMAVFCLWKEVMEPDWPTGTSMGKIPTERYRHTIRPCFLCCVSLLPIEHPTF